MIRSGKAAGWLRLPPNAFTPWATLNDVSFTRSVPGTVEGRGCALIAAEELNSRPDHARTLLTVPRDLILSSERVHDHAKADRDLRQVLECLDDYARTPRGAILSFLLVQVTASCPDLTDRVGVNNPFVEYVKSLPLEDLPTFWSASELGLLVGTTLAPAVASKLRSLRREYDRLCEAVENTRWYQIVRERLDFDDWLQVDAMYRSRALDFPGIGHCMIPCLDLANHAAGEATVAVYEKDGDGNAILLLRDGMHLHQGDEVTITYGDEKGACEMIFSYGFLDHHIKSAETLFLSLAIPSGDPYQSAKYLVADCAPGFKLSDAGDGETDWTGDFVWLLCVTADDGFRVEIASTVDGDEEAHAFFGDAELTGGAAQLRTILARHELWDVYRLRAITILQQRIFDQLQVLFTTQDDFEAMPRGQERAVREEPYEMASTLRRLEFELMESAYESFEHEKNQLVASPVVVQFLAAIDPAHDDDDDFA